MEIEEDILDTFMEISEVDHERVNNLYQQISALDRKESLEFDAEKQKYTELRETYGLTVLEKQREIHSARLHFIHEQLKPAMQKYEAVVHEYEIKEKEIELQTQRYKKLSNDFTIAHKRREEILFSKNKLLKTSEHVFHEELYNKKMQDTFDRFQSIINAESTAPDFNRKSYLKNL